MILMASYLLKMVQLRVTEHKCFGFGWMTMELLKINHIKKSFFFLED